MDMSVFIVQRKYGPYRALFEYLSAKNKTPEQEEARLKQLVQLAAMSSGSERAQMYTSSKASTSSYRRSASKGTDRLYKQAVALNKEISSLETYRAKQVTTTAEKLRADDEKKRLKAQQNIIENKEELTSNLAKQDSFMQTQNNYYSSSGIISDISKEFARNTKLTKYQSKAKRQADTSAGFINSGDELRTFFENARIKKQPLNDNEKINILKDAIYATTKATADGRLPYNGKTTILGEEKYSFQNPHPTKDGIEATVEGLALAIGLEYGLLDISKGVSRPNYIKDNIIDPELAFNTESITDNARSGGFPIPERNADYYHKEALKRVQETDNRIAELKGQQIDSKAPTEKELGDDVELDEALSELQAFYQYGSRPMVGRRPYLAPIVLANMKKFAVKTIPKVDTRLEKVGGGLTTAGLVKSALGCTWYRYRTRSGNYFMERRKEEKERKESFKNKN